MRGWNLDDPRKWPHVILALAILLSAWVFFTEPAMLGISPRLWISIAVAAFLVVAFAGTWARLTYPDAKAKADQENSRNEDDSTSG